MINHLYFLFLSIFIKSSKFAVCFDSYGDIQLVFDNITDPSIYKKWIRPPIDPEYDSNGPLFVNVSIDMYNYATIDEITSEYTFHLFIDMEWFDPRLKFSQHVAKGPNGDYPIIEGGTHHIEQVWYPSVFIPNNQDPGSFDYDHESANLLQLKSNGYVWLRKRKLLRVYCNMDFHLYPFDEQICYLHLESSISTVKNLKLRWNPNIAFSKADSFHTIGFELQHSETIETEKTYSKNNTFSRVSLKFGLVREWAHHLFLFYLPSTIIVLASWATFWLEITSPPARVTMGVTTMLALVTTFKNNKSQLPSVSYWNALDVWNMVCIVFIFATLVEFAAVNYIFNTEKRRIKTTKLKRKRQNTILMAKEANSVRRMSSMSSRSSVSTVDKILTSFRQLNKRLSDLRVKNDSDISKKTNNNKESTYESSKPRLSSVGIDFSKQMPDIKEETVSQRRQSIPRSRANTLLNENLVLKLTPQELAMEIDRKCRRIFPIVFIMFNILYWVTIDTVSKSK